MRVELRDGQWADLRERITHGQDKAIRRARLAGGKDPSVAYESVTVLLRAYVRDWYVNDPDGNPIPLGDEDAIDRCPEDIADELFAAGAELWTGVKVPNLPTPLSSEGSSSATP